MLTVKNNLSIKMHVLRKKANHENTIRTSISDRLCIHPFKIELYTLDH